MRAPRDWDEEYLLNLPIGEFDWLEVKGRRGLDLTLSSVDESNVKSNMSKAISAFANSGGGTLVFGLSNPSKNWQVDDGGIDLAVKRPGTRDKQNIGYCNYSAVPITMSLRGAWSPRRGNLHFLAHAFRLDLPD